MKNKKIIWMLLDYIVKQGINLYELSETLESCDRDNKDVRKALKLKNCPNCGVDLVTEAAVKKDELK